ARLRDGTLRDAPPHVTGDYPEWLHPHLPRVFGDDRAPGGAAPARPAPPGPLKHLTAAPTRGSPVGLRITAAADSKNLAIHSEPAFLAGLIEVQDEGSQLAALLTGAKAGEQVIDLCAGAGGKTLALAALLKKKGQIYAT